MEYFPATDAAYTTPFPDVADVAPYSYVDTDASGHDAYPTTDIIPGNDRYPDVCDTPSLADTSALFGDLREAGVSLEPVTLNDVAGVNSRDFSGDYPYVSVLPEKYGDTLDAVGVVVDDHVVAYSVAGMFADQDEQLGEIGMVHVSPEARNFGLGGLLLSVMHRRLLAQSPDGLHAVIGDSTGKMRHLFAGAGYEDFGFTETEEADPVMRRYFASAEERDMFAGEVNTAAYAQATRLNGRSDVLRTTAVGDVRDNPRKLDVPAVVAARLDEKGVLGDHDAITYFGQIGAPVRIARSALDKDGGYAIMLDMYGPSLMRIAERLQGRGRDTSVTILSPIRGTRPNTARLTSSPTLNEDRLRRSALRFARIAQAAVMR